jgi:peptidyl-prolyl cis-trans isomerase C
LTRIAGDPLVHFVLLGVGLFALHALLEGRHDERRIVVSRAVRDDLAREIQSQRGAPPTPAELRAAIERWKTEEALYREGLRQGLDQNDPVVRARVLEKLQSLNERLFLPPRPSDAELRTWVEARRPSYEAPERYDFEHVFVSNRRSNAEQVAAGYVTELESGKDFRGLGDPYPDGQVLAVRTPAELERALGRAFVDAIRALPVAKWKLLPSTQGWHAVRLRLREGGTPSFDKLKPELMQDLLKEARDKELGRRAAELRSRYEFVEEP